MVDLQNQNKYQMDYGTCTLTCVHHKLTRKNIKIPRILQGVFCVILPLILPNHPEAGKLNISKIVYESDPDFHAHCDGLILQLLCEYQQLQHIELMEVLTQVPPEFYKLIFHLWDNDEIVVNLINDSTRYMQWNKRFIHFVELHSVELYGHVYIDKINVKSSVQLPFHKSTRAKLKDHFITHIEGDPIFSTNILQKSWNNFIKSTYGNFRGWKERNNNNKFLFFYYFCS